MEFPKIERLLTWLSRRETAVVANPDTSITEEKQNLPIEPSPKLFEKLALMPVKLSNIANIFTGLQTSADDVFVLEEVRRDKHRVLCKSKATGRKHWLNDKHLQIFLKGSLDILRYLATDSSKRLLFPYEIRGKKSVLMDSKEYKLRYRLTWAYLEKNRRRLARRKNRKMGRAWYGYIYKKNHLRFGTPKLIAPSVATGSCFAYDLKGEFYFGKDIYGIELKNQNGLSYLFLLGLLNSRLLSTYLQQAGRASRDNNIKFDFQCLEQVPMPTLNLENPTDSFRHYRMVKLVTRMLDLNKGLASSQTAADCDMYQRLIAATDEQIDALVYALYGLTEEEIQVVEGK